MSEKNISSRAFLAGLAIGGGLLLAGCDNETINPEIGDTGVVTNSMEGVIDYNQIQIPKDTCVMESGTVYKVMDKSTLTLPSIKSSCYYDKSTDRNVCYNEPNIQPIIQLESENCTAWYPTSEVIKSTDLDNK